MLRVLHTISTFEEIAANRLPLITLNPFLRSVPVATLNSIPRAFPVLELTTGVAVIRG